MTTRDAEPARYAIGFVLHGEVRSGLPTGVRFEAAGDGIHLATVPASSAATPRARLEAGLALHDSGVGLVPFAPNLAVAPSTAADLADRRRAALRRLLALATGHDEITLTADLAGRDEERAGSNPAGRGPTSGRSWLQARSEGLRIDAALDAAARRFAEAVLARFTVLETRISIRSGRLFAAALVPRDRSGTCGATATRLTLDATAVRARPVLGCPWPLYSFCNLETRTSTTGPGRSGRRRISPPGSPTS